MLSFNIMASSTDHNQQHQELPNMDKITTAPPPTPSTQQTNNHLITSSVAAADVLTRLLHRLPPTLSLPSRRSSPPVEKSPPVISLSDPNSNELLLSASSQLGFFQLTNHNIPSELAHSAELESLSLFKLNQDQKKSYFPRNWPLGYDDGDEDGNGESFWLDSGCSTESTELALASLHELTQALEKVALETIDMLSRTMGFENPFKEDPNRFCSLMWVHQVSDGDNQPVTSGGFYPHVIGLQYQIRCQKYSLLADSGWVTMSPQVDSVMVTVGDIAQVWSNGKLKKVRGKPVACLGDGKNSPCISMSLLVTLPTESTISPLLPKVAICGNDSENEIREDEEHNHDNIFKKEKRWFTSFSFEDYAWRVYHERLFFKDPLDKYRI